jgi:hypothetical protein
VRTRCTIAILSRSPQPDKHLKATTSLLRWNAEYRDHLFGNLSFAYLNFAISVGIPKVSTEIQSDALMQLVKTGKPLAIDITRSIPFSELAENAPTFPQPAVYIGGTAYNWFPAWREIPASTDMAGRPSLPARTAGYRLSTEDEANIIFALLCSSLGYWWWAAVSDGFNLKKWLLERFPISVSAIPVTSRKKLARLGDDLRAELIRNYVYKDNKGRIGNFFLPACERQVRAIDDYLSEVVTGLTPEFFDDIRSFNASFSRANIEGDEDEEDD